MKYSKLLLHFSIFALMVFSFQCKHDPDVYPDDGANSPGDTTEIHKCDPDSSYFQNDVLPLLLSNCSGCHDKSTASGDVILVDYASVTSTGDIVPGDPEKSELFEKIIESDPDKRMPPPPGSALSSDQIDIIRTWIKQGAQNNSCNIDCDTTNVTFSGTIWPTIESNCVGCHTGSSAGGGTSITNYNELVAIAENGKLLGVLSHDPGYSPMPKNADKLSDCKIREIEIWIENGTPNN